jgi:hypothetical protein
MRFILLSSMLLLATICLAQTKGKAKLYGYSQAVAPGVASGSIDFGSSETSPGKAGGQNHFIYIAAAQQIYPSEIWINGAQFTPQVTRVSTTPVSRELNTGKKVLVPKTTLKVWQLTPAPAVNAKTTKGKALAQKNKLVVVYKQAGKYYYCLLPSFAPLEGTAMQ